MRKRVGWIGFVVCLVAALTLVLTPALAAQEGPLTSAKIIKLLQAGKSGTEIAGMVKARGIDFSPFAIFVQNLEALNADPVLLEIIKTPARLQIRVSAAGAAVWVDGDERGTVPADGPLVVEGLLGGRHVIRIRAEDYVGKTEEVFLKPAEDHTASFELASAISATLGPFGTNVSVAAGTSTNRRLREIYDAADLAVKVTLLDKFAERYRESPAALLAYGMLQQTHIQQKNFDRALAAGEQALQHDPGGFEVRLRQAEAAVGQGDMERALEEARQMMEVLEKGKAMPPPEGVAQDSWNTVREQGLRRATSLLPTLEYNLFVAVYQQPAAAARSTAMERFATIFPESNYRTSAMAAAALAFQEQGNAEKMLEWADRALEADPSQVTMLMLVCDNLSETGRDLDRAQELARRLLDLVTNQPGKARAPGITDEQWATQKQLLEGVAHSALGQLFLHQGKDNDAIGRFAQASSLLKGQPYYYARNLYRHAFILGKLGGRGNLGDASKILTELVALDSPFKVSAQDLLNRINQALALRKK